MTIQLDPAVVYHAGDLVGYDKRGRPMYLPGGGARDGAIVVDDKDDDEPDDFDADDDDDDDDEPPAPPTKPAKPPKPSYRDLLDQIAKLQAGQQRNNKELARRRVTAQWMDRHGIEDLDAWLEERGIDKETGQVKGSPAPAPAPEGTPSAPPVAPVTPEASPAAENTPPPVDDAEIQRRVQLELEKRGAREAERASVLEQSLRNSAIENALKGIGFAGTLSKAMLLIDAGKITVGDDGTVTGAAEAAQGLREEIPEWFRRRAPNGVPPRPGGEGIDGGDKRPPPPARKKWDEQVVDRWRGR